MDTYDEPFLNIFRNRSFSGPIRVNEGGGQNLFFIGILTTLFRLTAFFLVEKQRPQSEERKEKEKIMPWTIASTFMPAATGSTRTPLGQPAIT